jgi:hypothetical protein
VKLCQKKLENELYSLTGETLPENMKRFIPRWSVKKGYDLS